MVPLIPHAEQPHVGVVRARRWALLAVIIACATGIVLMHATASAPATHAAAHATSHAADVPDVDGAVSRTPTVTDTATPASAMESPCPSSDPHAAPASCAPLVVAAGFSSAIAGEQGSVRGDGAATPIRTAPLDGATGRGSLSLIELSVSRT